MANYQARLSAGGTDETERDLGRMNVTTFDWLPWLFVVVVCSGAVMLLAVPALAYRASAVLFAWAESMEYFSQRRAAHIRRLEAGNGTV